MEGEVNRLRNSVGEYSGQINSDSKDTPLERSKGRNLLRIMKVYKRCEVVKYAQAPSSDLILSEKI